MPASTESANSAEMMIFMTLSPCVMQAEEMACGYGDNGSVLGRKLCCKSQEAERTKGKGPPLDWDRNSLIGYDWLPR